MRQQSGKVKKLDNDFTRRREIELNNSKVTAVLSNRRKKRALVIGAIFLFFASIFLIQIVRAKVNYADVHVQIAREQKDLKQQKVANKQLKAQVSQLNDKSYVEQIIRDRYYYTKPGETVYSFPNKAPKDVNDYDVK
ncbi:FtsB family cell division protein [Lentilactobacillus otakiensis]|uniref:Septum formation initiator n=1 Tax=Lentilactobacillus otakiensis DSM 19908 = JCM 15040 TaxID=1423780 RepID=S4PQW1_9LACO|nr:septum formation initiator family protein [Lentilactobacillus otakiensis]MBZ3776074.1 septum formation initiator family protein [Lentilactobacillus otakiensis]MDV3519145.1 septum formation initiator family protein [Lentilactobacillus otakiensis]GAD17550.1 septum formation initiator [Lentilactobacillus otakiensis DSM 19908 = JCM 15040]